MLRVLPLPGGAGFSPIVSDAERLSDLMLPGGTFRRFPLERAVRLVLDVLSALRALHEARIEGSTGFLHGEVSPRNVFVDEQGTARLVPLVSAHFSALSKPEATGYVAPERLLGDTADLRADLFSVGVMLWEALSGARLFPEKAAESTLERLLGGKLGRATPPPACAWAQPLSAIAERAVAVDPKARWSSARELRSAMVDAVGRHLAESAGESWPDEAPTPVLQPRLHLSLPRTTTPPPSVLSLPLPDSDAGALAPLPEAAAVVPGTSAPASMPAAQQPQPQRRRRARQLAALAFAAALPLGGGVAAFEHPSSSRALASAIGRLLAPPTARLEPAPGQAATLAAASGLEPASRADGSAPPRTALAPAPSNSGALAASPTVQPLSSAHASGDASSLAPALAASARRPTPARARRMSPLMPARPLKGPTAARDADRYGI